MNWADVLMITLTAFFIYFLKDREWRLNFNALNLFKAVVYIIIYNSMRRADTVFFLEKSELTNYFLIVFYVVFILGTLLKDKRVQEEN